MGVSVLILGVSGTGKSASMRNFKSDQIGLVNVARKPLPFKGKFGATISTDDYTAIKHYLKATINRSVVIDDAQYLMGNEFMRRVTEKGYDKFSEMAKNFNDLLQTIRDLPDDRIVYLLGHIEQDQNGNEKFKTMGKLIDQCINVEGTTTIVLKTAVTDGKYYFLTQNSGKDTVKSPMGMFPSYAIENDLAYVDEKIRNYYEIGDFKSDADMKEADKTVAADLEKPDVNGRRARTSRTRAQVEADNNKKVDAYVEDCGKAIDAVSDDLEEVPFEEAMNAVESVPQPELKTPPRRTRRERTEEVIKPPAEPEQESVPTGRRRRTR